MSDDGGNWRKRSSRHFIKQVLIGEMEMGNGLTDFGFLGVSLCDYYLIHI